MKTLMFPTWDFKRSQARRQRQEDFYWSLGLGQNFQKRLHGSIEVKQKKAEFTLYLISKITSAVKRFIGFTTGFHNYVEGRVAIRHYANQTACPL